MIGRRWHLPIKFLICWILLIDGIHTIDFENSQNPGGRVSTPEQCARACKKGTPPKICYYHFTLEYYTVSGAACKLCTPNATNVISSNCQCVLADGVERGMLTANRMIPGPSIQVCQGDKVIIDVENHMEGMEVALHWHGIWQRGSQYYDGVPFVTQCPIHQGNTFRYQWMASNAGTHFWHAHTGLQDMDGLHGSIIIRQPPNRDPNSHLYDFDLTTHVMVLSDWLHENPSERFPGRLTTHAGHGADNILINGKGQFRDSNIGFTTNTPLEVFTIKPGRRYRFRMINAFASVCPAQLTIQGHDLIVIATDGVPVKPVSVNTIISFAGERYDFVINANQKPGAYWIQVKGLRSCAKRQVQQLGVLRYPRSPYRPTSLPPSYPSPLPTGVVLNPPDFQCNRPRPDAICVNQLKNAGIVDESILKQPPDVKVFLPYTFYGYKPQELFTPNIYNQYLVTGSGNHIISLVDGISFQLPPAPLLSQYDEIHPKVFCNSNKRPSDCRKNCTCTHKIDLPLNAVVEIILFDEGTPIIKFLIGINRKIVAKNSTSSHPFHLHGYAFNVVGMGRSPDENLALNLEIIKDLDRHGLLQRNHLTPPGKDTITVPGSGYVILRFRASNPGFWLFHCHFLFHIVIGMTVVFQVGTQADLPPIPPNFPRCGNFLPPIETKVWL